MAYRHVLLASVQREYASIVGYLHSTLGSPQAAKSFVDEFDEKVALICNDPHMHAPSRMPELAARGYRPFFVKRYVVLYRIEGDLVVIAHIFHQTQDYARLV